MQTESTRWDIFARTGKIDDYLAYRRECAQNAANDNQTGDVHATDDQRHHPAPPPHPRG